jgi:hypothetical protein
MAKIGSLRWTHCQQENHARIYQGSRKQHLDEENLPPKIGIHCQKINLQKI